MNKFTRHLHRLFWSLYGPVVWDEKRSTERLPLIRTVTGLLLIRRKNDNEQVLDAGCGTGSYSLSLAQAGFDVLGIDFAAGMIASARSKTTDEMLGHAYFEVADLNRPLPFTDEHFDHCINISVLQVLEDPAATLKELWRVLKPEGTLLLLHVPRLHSEKWSYREAVRSRMAKLETKGLFRQILVAAKVYAEQTSAVNYWTEQELYRMLTRARFRPLSTESHNPILVLAEKLPEPLLACGESASML